LAEPWRGDIWTGDLDPVRGHEQAGTRPVLIVSDDDFNHGPAGLVYAVPLTRKFKRQPAHIRIVPPEGGLRSESYIMADQLRVLSKDRLSGYRGRVTSETLVEVEARLRYLLSL
jgi:mRNA interferase MazF